MTFTWWIDEPVLKGSGNPTDEDLAELRAQGFATAVSLLEERALSNGAGVYHRNLQVTEQGSLRYKRY
jgi:hypothetical protein